MLILSKLSSAILRGCFKRVKSRKTLRNLAFFWIFRTCYAKYEAIQHTALCGDCFTILKINLA